VAGLTHIFLGNREPEYLVGTALGRDSFRGQRTVWHAKDGDILVLAAPPQMDFIRHAASITDTDISTMHFAIPQCGESNSDQLTDDRLRDPLFHAKMLELCDSLEITAIEPMWPSPVVAEFAAGINAEAALPGAHFIAQGGGILANSKAAFRVFAAGAGVPITPGAVCMTEMEAERIVTDLLADGPVILKGEYFAGGRGNQILAPGEGSGQLGATSLTVIPDRAALQTHFPACWTELTVGGRHKLVVERYIPGCTSWYAEYLLRDDGIHFTGDGHLVKNPLGVAQVTPLTGLSEPVHREILEQGERLCSTLHAVGYRGIVSADAIVDAGERVYFTEFNGRTTDSTYLYERIGKEVVGGKFPSERIVREQLGLKVSSFAEATRRLEKCGLAYSRDTRTGAFFTSPYNERSGSLAYCVVGKDEDAIGAMLREIEEHVGEI
jgi:hypothetical protein